MSMSSSCERRCRAFVRLGSAGFCPVALGGRLLFPKRAPKLIDERVQVRGFRGGQSVTLWHHDQLQCDQKKLLCRWRWHCSAVYGVPHLAVCRGAK